MKRISESLKKPLQNHLDGPTVFPVQAMFQDVHMVFPDILSILLYVVTNRHKPDEKTNFYLNYPYNDRLLHQYGCKFNEKQGIMTRFASQIHSKKLKTQKAKRVCRVIDTIHAGEQHGVSGLWLHAQVELNKSEMPYHYSEVVDDKY